MKTCRRSTVLLATLLVLAVAYTNNVHATLVRIDLNYEKDLGSGQTDPNDSIMARAFLSTPALFGPGVEDILVSAFDLQFSTRAGTSNPNSEDLTLQTAVFKPNGPDILARFDNGVFQFLYNTAPPGPLGVQITPSISRNKEFIFLGANTLGLNTLTDTIEFSSFNVPYVEVGQSITTLGPSPIPLPGGLILFGSAIAGLIGLRKTRRLRLN